ncbi:MAG TPA: aminoacyl-tRNA hydrolase [Candidatus Eisenbacteria bacterium]|nr:aminoacyl-tRNA hydrolase [Candidatus Eisenbacteria bacterium]
MRLVVGLGNPGARYAATRHNVAWQVLDELARRWDAREHASTPLYAARRARVKGGDVDLMQPLTFMNLAGDAVGRWLQENQGPPEDLLVVSDDVYLPVGTIRVRARGSSGGHRGLESVEQAWGSSEFARLRIGVGAAASSAELKEHVLETFTPDERVVMDEATRRAADAVECWAADGIMAAMNRFNRRIQEESEP